MSGPAEIPANGPVGHPSPEGAVHLLCAHEAHQYVGMTHVRWAALWVSIPAAIKVCAAGWHYQPSPTCTREPGEPRVLLPG
ncbi:MAG: hypothetical protein ACRDRA_12470 [Pseudonocardiaceae bacterium]